MRPDMWTTSLDRDDTFNLRNSNRFHWSLLKSENADISAE